MSIIWIEYLITYKQVLNSKIWSCQKKVAKLPVLSKSWFEYPLIDIPAIHVFLCLGWCDFPCEPHKWRKKKKLGFFSLKVSSKKHKQQQQDLELFCPHFCFQFSVKICSKCFLFILVVNRRNTIFLLFFFFSFLLRTSIQQLFLQTCFSEL